MCARDDDDSVVRQHHTYIIIKHNPSRCVYRKFAKSVFRSVKYSREKETVELVDSLREGKTKNKKCFFKKRQVNGARA